MLLIQVRLQAVGEEISECVASFEILALQNRRYRMPFLCDAFPRRQVVSSCELIINLNTATCSGVMRGLRKPLEKL